MKNKKNIIGALIIIGLGMPLISLIKKPKEKYESTEEMRRVMVNPPRGFPTPTPNWIDEEHAKCLYMFGRNITPEDDSHCLHHHWHWQKDPNFWGEE